MATYSSIGEMLARENVSDHAAVTDTWPGKYRGATVEDLDPPPALSVSPDDSISSAQLAAYERDYSHLTVISSSTRALLGYLSIPRLKHLLREGKVRESDPVKAAMQRFNRKRSNVYTVITMDTPLEDLERFFKGDLPQQQQQSSSSNSANEGGGESETGTGTGTAMGKQDFAIVTDPTRKFVLGVVTEGDLREFVRRRP